MSDCKINFYRNGILVKEPANWKGLEIELNFDRDKDIVEESVNLTEFQLVNENADLSLDYIDAGISNGVGVLEGEPLAIEIERNGVVEKPFNGYLDYTTGTFSKDGCAITAKEVQSIDWLNDIMDSFTMEYLHKEIGSITTSDFINASIPLYQMIIGICIALIAFGIFARIFTKKRSRL